MGIVKRVVVSSIAMRRGVLKLRWVMVDSNASEKEQEHCAEDQYIDVNIGRHGVRVKLRIKNFEC